MPVHFDIQYAGLPRRALSVMVDLVLVGILTSAGLALIHGVEYVRQLHEANALAAIDWRVSAIEQVLTATWFIGFWACWQATPGKQLLDCQVVDADTLQRPRLTRLLIRYLGYLVSGLALGLGFLWALFDRRRQGWHDKMANTLVIMQDESLHDRGLKR